MYDYDDEQYMLRWMTGLHIRGNPLKDMVFTVVFRLESKEWAEVTIDKEQALRDGKVLVNGFGDWMGLHDYIFNTVGRVLGKMTRYNGAVLEVLDGLLLDVYGVRL